MLKRSIYLLLVLALLLALPGNALAQDYYFQLTQNHVEVFWNADGTMSIQYTMVFDNSSSGHAIEFIDLGMPNRDYVESSITADVDGKPVAYVSSSEFEGKGVGVAIALGSNSIPPGRRGTVHISVGTVRKVLFTDDEDPNYASAVFGPAYFNSNVAYGSTDLRVAFHLPPGVKPEEPRWHASPSGGWPAEPLASLDAEGRVTYVWHNPSANAWTYYGFGASFPQNYVSAGTVADKSTYQPVASTGPSLLNWDEDTVMGFLCCGGVGGFIALTTWFGVVNEKRRKMKYLPPKIRIEGHGIKRGLTAIEAAILMEQPMDKVLTMILFSVIKKNAARVISREPLKLEISEPRPEKLHGYEIEFLDAFAQANAKTRRAKLQKTLIEMITSVSQKMKGFSHKETVDYYQKIMEKAWQQVEAADTPEVKSQKFDDHMGWTMLDKDFEGRTQEVFRSGPVYVPIWWHNYDPGWGRTVGGGLKSASPVSSVGGAGGRSSVSLPNLPGSEFAASVVTGIQGFAGNVVGNVTDFTGGITNKTNPVPKSTSSGGSWKSGGGSSCACACACAGCACACAGGGR